MVLLNLFEAPRHLYALTDETTSDDI